MTAGSDLSGLWLGSYSYPIGLAPTVPFLARIEENGGSLAGSTVEPDMVGAPSETLEALIRGSRSGASVDFTKTYDGKAGVSNSVDYVGRLSADGNTISGVWSMAELDGTFEMHREAVWEQRAGREAEVARL